MDTAAATSSLQMASPQNGTPPPPALKSFSPENGGGQPSPAPVSCENRAFVVQPFEFNTLHCVADLHRPIEALLSRQGPFGAAGAPTPPPLPRMDGAGMLEGPPQLGRPCRPGPRTAVRKFPLSLFQKKNQPALKLVSLLHQQNTGQSCSPKRMRIFASSFVSSPTIHTQHWLSWGLPLGVALTCSD